MTTPYPAPELYYSVLGGDPELAEIVAMFVEEMPARVREMSSYFSGASWEQLGRVAHQLKGAAGSYGFDQITPFAARLEKAVRDRQGESTIQTALDDLVDACGRLRAGAPAKTKERKSTAPGKTSEQTISASGKRTPPGA